MNDWTIWSREAVALMSARNKAWPETYALEAGCPYRWDLATATLTFLDSDGRRRLAARIQLVGSLSLSEGTFLWSWANGTFPPGSWEEMHKVRQFGTDHDLLMLTTGEWRAGSAEALEALAIAGRVLGAPGCWIDSAEDPSVYFVILGFERLAR
jgi:hypothetical protein